LPSYNPGLNLQKSSRSGAVPVRSAGTARLTEMCTLNGMSARRQGVLSATTSDLSHSTSLAGDVLLSCLQRRRPSLLGLLNPIISSHRICHLIVLNDNSRHFCFVYTRLYCATLAY